MSIAVIENPTFFKRLWGYKDYSSFYLFFLLGRSPISQVDS